MDEALNKSGDWPNVALIPGTHTHAATGDQIEQPENTRIGRSRAADGPETAEPEQMPAEVENRPQNGAKCDTREKVLADLKRLAHEWHDYDGNFMRIYNHVAYAQVKELLDRQDAITRREFDGECELCQSEVARLQEQVDSLTAERDKLQCERNAAISRASYMESAAAEELAKLLGENETIEVYDDKPHGKRRLVTGTQRKLEKQVTELTAERNELLQKTKQLEAEFSAMRDRAWGAEAERDELTAEVEKQRQRANDAERGLLSDEWYVARDRYEDDVAALTAERDSLRDRLKTQANSFQKLERDNAKLRDTLARVQELVGDAE